MSNLAHNFKRILEEIRSTKWLSNPDLLPKLEKELYDVIFNNPDEVLELLTKITLYEKRKDGVKNMIEIQKQSGNYNYDSYMFGMANGMILIDSTLSGEEPEFLDKPEVWLKDKNEPFVCKTVESINMYYSRGVK